MTKTTSSSFAQTPKIKSKSSSNDNRNQKINKKILLSAIIGNGLEFYDFALFGAFSVTFSTLFFAEDSISSLVKTLSIFALAFFIRPLGSIFFGYLGDQFGRKKALSYSIVFMGLFTFLIGCLPLYKDVSYLAPLLLLGCRLGQGFCLGGENNGSSIFLLEHLKARKGFAGALILTGGAIGTILATGLSAIANLPEMPGWTWRIPFICGILIGFLGNYIRRSVDETPEFISTKEKNKRKAPLLFVLTHYHKPFLCAIGIGGMNGVLAYTLVVYLNVYLSTVVNYSLASALFSSCVGLIIFGSLAPLIGHIADKIGERKVMSVGCLLTFCSSPFLFYLLQQKNLSSVFAAIFLSALMMGSFNAPTNALLQRLFPTEVRYTGIALGYAVGIALLGGTQPLICTYLIETTQDPLSPALYLMFSACVGGAALFFSRKTTDASLGFSQMMPEYSLPSNRKSSGISTREKKVASKT
ncbi:MAG: MFS transporter [Alphaproteobacteria bacterium]|nr:MFS transporter [Alphaproteobacteria bacterium]